MRLRVKNGLDIPIKGEPAQSLMVAPTVRRVAIVGVDYGEPWPALAVANGDRVRAGEVLFCDRKHPAIRFTAPSSGVVTDVQLGRGGRLAAVVMDRTDDPPCEWAPLSAAVLRALPADAVRARLLESGLWVALRARPYEGIAQPDVAPRALFVTAIDTNPLAANPLHVICGDAANFYAGVLVLSRLTEGSTYVCTAPRAAISIPERRRVHQVEFAGPHPAGLPGTHIHALQPRMGDVPDLWHVGYQDVIAIGRVFREGRLATHRTVALSGPKIRAPTLARVPLGSELNSLVPEASRLNARVLSGSALAGRQMPAFLGRYHDQVTVLPEMPPLRSKVSRLLRALPGLRGDRIESAAQNESPGGMLPLENFDRVWPFASSPSPLLRALLIGDVEEALNLGCLGLAEEDLALCTYVCAGKTDYGAALRAVLRKVERGAA